jgi:hypothetical protein
MRHNHRHRLLLLQLLLLLLLLLLHLEIDAPPVGELARPSCPHRLILVLPLVLRRRRGQRGAQRQGPVCVEGHFNLGPHKVVGVLPLVDPNAEGEAARGAPPQRERHLKAALFLVAAVPADEAADDLCCVVLCCVVLFWFLWCFCVFLGGGGLGGGLEGWLVGSTKPES